jgi:hypothetical protein
MILPTAVARITITVTLIAGQPNTAVNMKWAVPRQASNRMWQRVAHMLVTSLTRFEVRPFTLVSCLRCDPDGIRRRPRNRPAYIAERQRQYHLSAPGLPSGTLGPPALAPDGDRDGVARQSIQQPDVCLDDHERLPDRFRWRRGSECGVHPAWNGRVTTDARTGSAVFRRHTSIEHQQRAQHRDLWGVSTESQSIPRFSRRIGLPGLVQILRFRWG